MYADKKSDFLFPYWHIFIIMKKVIFWNTGKQKLSCGISFFIGLLGEVCRSREAFFYLAAATSAFDSISIEITWKGEYPHQGVVRRKPGFICGQFLRECHANDRLSDRRLNNDFDTKSRHITRHLFNVMQICRLLALVTEFSGFPA